MAKVQKDKPKGGNRCEGWRRYGGAFSWGPPIWKQCCSKGIVMLIIKHAGKMQKPTPACMTCWKEAKATKGIVVVSAEPIIR